MNQDDPGSDFTENGTARYDQEHTQTTSESGRRTSADADPPEKPNIFRQVAASSFMITYGLWAGFIMGYNAVGIPSFCRDDQRPFDMTIHSRSLFASTTNIAGLLGSLCSGLVPRRISGQTWFLICLLLPMCFLWILIAYSPVFPLMLAARALQGFFGSVYMAYSQVYTSEVAHKSVRGFLLSLVMISLAVGQQLCYTIGYFSNWKVLAYCAAAIPLSLMPILLMLPLSPVWLVENERYEDAAKSVGWLCGRRCNVEAEVEDIKKHLEEAQESQPTFRDLLRFTYLKPCFLAASIALLRQFCGYFTVICFTVSIFQSAGSSINPNIATIIVGLVVLVFTCINSFSVDKFGRRRLAITSSFSMTLMLTLLGAYFEYKDRLSNYGWLPLAALVIFVASFSMGISSLMFIIIGELVPIQIKSRVTGLILGVGWVSQFITLQTYEYMREAFHDSGTFWFYACCCAVLLLVCVFALPETKGRSLREIERDVTHSKRSADDDTQPTDIS